MDRLVELLSSVNMAPYYYVLAGHGVTSVEDCWQLNEDALIAMGVNKVVHRRKLLNAIETSRPPAIVNNTVIVVCVQFKWGRTGTYRIPAMMPTELFRTGVAVLVEDAFEGAKGYDLGLIAGQVVQPSMEELASPFLLRVATEEEAGRWGTEVTAAEKRTFGLVSQAAGLQGLQRCEYRFDMQLISLHMAIPPSPDQEETIHSLFPTTQVRVLQYNPARDAANAEALRHATPKQPLQPITARVPETAVESEGECGLSLSSSDASDFVESLASYY